MALKIISRSILHLEALDIEAKLIVRNLYQIGLVLKKFLYLSAWAVVEVSQAAKMQSLAEVYLPRRRKLRFWTERNCCMVILDCT